MNHLLENQVPLQFAKENLPPEQFNRLFRSRRQLLWFQVFPWILAALGLILVLIFVPSEETLPGHASRRETILLFGSMFYIFFYGFWLILSQFLVGKLWHRYVKWFRKGDSIEKLYQLLSENGSPF